MGRTIDIDKLCTDLMERWDIADKQKEELVRQVMADIVVPIVVSQPTVEPERKKGKWTEVEEDEYWGMWYRCSECGKTSIRGNFCKNCGADMRELENKPRP